jgi:uncharacterized protein YhaN
MDDSTTDNFAKKKKQTSPRRWTSGDPEFDSHGNPVFDSPEWVRLFEEHERKMEHERTMRDARLKLPAELQALREQEVQLNKTITANIKEEEKHVYILKSLREEKKCLEDEHARVRDKIARFAVPGRTNSVTKVTKGSGVIPPWDHPPSATRKHN